MLQILVLKNIVVLLSISFERILFRNLLLPKKKNSGIAFVFACTSIFGQLPLSLHVLRFLVPSSSVSPTWDFQHSLSHGGYFFSILPGVSFIVVYTPGWL